MSTPESSGGMPDLSAMLSAVLSNPSAMAMLSSLLAGKVGGDTPAGSDPSTGARAYTGASGVEGTQGAQAALPAMAPLQPPHAVQDEKAALIHALRPFLPPEKCEMIDGLLRIMDLLFLIRGRRH